MGAKRFFTVFAAVIEADWTDFLPKSLHEFLEVLEDQSTGIGQVIIVVGQGDEARFIVHLALMHTANRPLARAFQAAAYALTAWNRERLVSLGELRMHSKTVGLLVAPAVERTITRHRDLHQSRMPPRIEPVI